MNSFHPVMTCAYTAHMNSRTGRLRIREQIMNEITATPCRISLCDHGDHLHMVEDHVAGELTLIERVTEVSDRLYGGASNPHFTDDRSRVIAADVLQNVHGEFIARLTLGRTVDYAGNVVPFYSQTGASYSSPVFTVREDAEEWAAEALRWAVDSMVSTFTTLSPFPLASPRLTYCSSCGHFDTLKLSMEAWADVTTCSTPGCTYEDRRSIGD